MGRHTYVIEMASTSPSKRQRSTPPSPEPSDERASDSVLLLNVGGRIFHALRSTLLREPDSMLAKMFDSGTQFGELAADSDGNPFIDRSADTFAFVLAYLRQSGRLIGARALSVEQLENLLEDAQYFGLEGLVAAVGDVVAEKNEAAEEFESKRIGEIIAAEKRGDEREKQRQRELAREAERRQAARDGSRTYEYRKVMVMYDHETVKAACCVAKDTIHDSGPSRMSKVFRAMKQFLRYEHSLREHVLREGLPGDLLCIGCS
jgi:hypothetical protein